MSNIIKLNDEIQGNKDAAIMQMMSDSSAFFYFSSVVYA